LTVYGSPPADIAARVPRRQVALVDLLDRVLAGGVVIVGDVTVSIAEVDLIRISLRALVVSLRGGMPDAVVSAAGHRAEHDE
jgi:Gas vesicle protein